MKLQIRTQAKKTLVVDIPETCTVYELKKELTMYPDIDVQPELQLLTYAGKMLEDEAALNTYKIDVKKLITIEILKKPLEKRSSKVTAEQQGSGTATPPKTNETEATTHKFDSLSTDSKATGDTFKIPTAKESNDSGTAKKEEIVQKIVGMGYAEPDVRRALSASFNNPERAIQYLIEGIPTSPSAPEDHSYTETDQSMAAIDVFLADPRLKILRNRLIYEPEYLAEFLQKLADDDPELLSLISENQDAFFKALVETEDIDGDDDSEDVLVEEFVGDLDENDFGDGDGDDDDLLANKTVESKKAT